jgi:transposase
MPWRETGVMDERMAFVVAVRKEETAVAQVCRQFGISRTTGYRWLTRVGQERLAGLTDRSRARKTQAHATPAASVAEIVALKHRYPSWGPKKLTARLHTLRAEGRLAADVVIPAPSKMGATSACIAHWGRIRSPRPRPHSPANNAATLPSVTSSTPNGPMRRWR